MIAELELELQRLVPSRQARHRRRPARPACRSRPTHPRRGHGPLRVPIPTGWIELVQAETARDRDRRAGSRPPRTQAASATRSGGRSRRACRRPSPTGRTPARRSRRPLRPDARPVRRSKSSPDGFGISADRARAALSRPRVRAVGSCSASSDRVAPSGSGATPKCCGSLRRRSLAALRHEIEPVDATTYARFLAAWQGIGRGRRGTDALVEALEQLQGVAVPASVLERDVLAGTGRRLPARHARRAVRGRRAGVDRRRCARRRRRSGPPASSATGCGCSPLAASTALPTAGSPTRSTTRSAIGSLRAGASFWPDLVAATGVADEVAVLGRAVGSRVGGRGHQRHASGRCVSLAAAGAPAVGAGPARIPGGWPALGPARGRGPMVARRAVARTRAVPDRARAHAAALQLLERHGVVTREAVRAEGTSGGFAGVYPVLRALEESGRARRGWFVDGSRRGTVRAPGRGRPSPSPPNGRRGRAAACSSCSPRPIPRSRTAPRWHGPSGRGHRRGRRARPGAYVVLDDGACAAYLERGGKALITFALDPTARPDTGFDRTASARQWSKRTKRDAWPGPDRTNRRRARLAVRRTRRALRAVGVRRRLQGPDPAE